MVLGIILGALAIIFGVLGKKKLTTDPSLGGRGMALAGIILGIIGLVISVLIIILLVTLFATVATVTSPYWFLPSY